MICCILYTLHYILYYILYIIYYILFLLYVIYYILYVIYYTLYGIYYILYMCYVVYMIYYILHIIYGIYTYYIYIIHYILYIIYYMLQWGRAKPHPIWNMACATTSIYLAKNGSLLTAPCWYGGCPALLKPSGTSKSPNSWFSETFNHATSLPNKAYDRQHMQKEIYNINPSWFCSGVCLCVCLYLSHLGWTYAILCHAVSFAYHWNASETNLM